MSCWPVLLQVVKEEVVSHVKALWKHLIERDDVATSCGCRGERRFRYTAGVVLRRLRDLN
jgi:hypothetical protein